MREIKYFIVVCQEMDAFDGLVVHINKKAKDLNEVHEIVMDNVEKYPNGKWELYNHTIKL